jgi:hypothetical protein
MVACTAPPLFVAVQCLKIESINVPPAVSRAATAPPATPVLFSKRQRTKVGCTDEER